MRASSGHDIHDRPTAFSSDRVLHDPSNVSTTNGEILSCGFITQAGLWKAGIIGANSSFKKQTTKGQCSHIGRRDIIDYANMALMPEFLEMEERKKFPPNFINF